MFTLSFAAVTGLPLLLWTGAKHAAGTPSKSTITPNIEPGGKNFVEHFRHVLPELPTSATSRVSLLSHYLLVRCVDEYV